LARQVVAPVFVSVEYGKMLADDLPLAIALEALRA
jgi:hypothetical protein